MTQPNALTVADYAAAFYKAAWAGSNKDPNTVTEGGGIKVQVTGGVVDNATIVGPVDVSGNVKVAVQGTVNDNATIVGPVDGSGNVKTAIQNIPAVTLSGAANAVNDTIVSPVTTLSAVNYVNTVPPQVVQKYVSTIGSGTTAAAPAANTTIASVSIAATGYYQVDVYCGFGSTAETTTNDNFVIKAASTTIGTPSVSNVANTMGQPIRFYCAPSGSTTIVVNVGGTAGSAGSIYKAMIVVTRIGS